MGFEKNRNVIYSVINVVDESKCLVLKRISQVFASALKGSVMLHLPLRCSSNKTIKNLINIIPKMCFLPILIGMLFGIELIDE